MAFRGSASQVTSGIGFSNTSTVTVSSIGIQQYDFILLIVQGGGGGSNTFTYPTGFNPINNLPNQEVQYEAATLGINYKIATASEPTTYTVVSSATDYMTTHCRVYSGRSIFNPISLAVAGASVDAATTPVTYTMPTGTASANDDLIQIVGNGYYLPADGAFSFVAPNFFANSSLVYGSNEYAPCITVCDYVNYPGGTTSSVGGTINTPTQRTDMGYTPWVLSLAATGPVLLGAICL